MIDKKITAVTQTTSNTLMTATNADLNLDSGLGQAHTCIRVKAVNEIIINLLQYLDHDNCTTM